MIDDSLCQCKHSLAAHDSDGCMAVIHTRPGHTEPCSCTTAPQGALPNIRTDTDNRWIGRQKPGHEPTE